MEAAGKFYIAHGRKSDEIKLWDLADFHWGAKACAETKLKRDLKRIANDPYSFWFGGGDLVDCIGYTDTKRFDPDAVAEHIRVQDLGELGAVLIRGVEKLLRPIKHKCIGLGIGNHCKVYETRHEQKLMQWLCTEFNVDYLGYSAIFDLILVYIPRLKQPFLSKTFPAGGVRSERFRVLFHHGSGFATTTGGKLNKLLKFIAMSEADVFFLSHVHEPIAHPVIRLTANESCTKIVERYLLGLITGSYLKTYATGLTTYGEQRLYSPVPLGAKWVRFIPYPLEHEQRLRAEI